MTYIAAWRLGPYAYLVADTAITVEDVSGQSSSREQAASVTSFGEKDVSEPGRVVYEGVLKTINLGRAVVLMCGDVRLARSVIGSIERCLQAGLDGTQAFQQAIVDNGPFDDSERQIHLIVAFPEHPQARLLAFNIDGDLQIHEVPDETAVQFGSMPSKYKSIFPQMINTLKIFAGEPDRFLTGILGIVQSYGLHDYLMENSVGGTFCGAVVGSSDIRWQKDILYVLHKSQALPTTDKAPHIIEMITSIVRDHVLVVRSNITDSCRYFGDSINRGLDENWRAKWWDLCFDFTSHGRFDYVVALNTDNRVVSVVETLGHLRTKHLRISPKGPQSKEEAFRLDVAFSPQLFKVMIQPDPPPRVEAIFQRFNWFPYEPPEESGNLS